MLAVTVVIPAYMEDASIAPVLMRLLAAVQTEVEVLVIVDLEEDSTVPVVRRFEQTDPRVRLLVSTYGRGPAHAIRYGVDHASHPICVITMADGSDDPEQIDALARLVDRGVVIAAASRYSAGGQQVGGPLVKSLLSQGAGRSLGFLARVGTYDATNSYKAYSTEFLRTVLIQSRGGFEMGIELTAKARRLRLPVAEIPTIWIERDSGESNFKMWKWLPSYLRWYRFAFGPAMSVEQVVVAGARIAAAASQESTGRAW